MTQAKQFERVCQKIKSNKTYLALCEETGSYNAFRMILEERLKKFPEAIFDEDFITFLDGSIVIVDIDAGEVFEVEKREYKYFLNNPCPEEIERFLATLELTYGHWESYIHVKKYSLSGGKEFHDAFMIDFFGSSEVASTIFPEGNNVGNPKTRIKYLRKTSLKGVIPKTSRFYKFNNGEIDVAIIDDGSEVFLISSTSIDVEKIRKFLAVYMPNK